MNDSNVSGSFFGMYTGTTLLEYILKITICGVDEEKQKKIFFILIETRGFYQWSMVTAGHLEK